MEAECYFCNQVEKSDEFLMSRLNSSSYSPVSPHGEVVVMVDLFLGVAL